ncbi:MAG: RNA 2',3'-cyclic phosphodiesterase [Candidatus Thiodiazotropha lotti]|uniref:RNA 2',3'-cyclic phosphodiesterase n=1 Tax=Candidatus Thiodiazotropha endoloripes TaxID=1818881 RepID=UPI00083CA8FA|nr:RNA 2',3'-cyclic phosphodiesterase [Candidatus Thiodiazotropha endoloripes]MCG7904584.1 RNA 2',3'-cyclic phosphodiesterase [Candidatus Thiodiazotropha weberae]MCG7993763.1 RNA 2',3'-cyclic phosphodiesterase [Candidatus Thiodiazotropha lotti]MCG7915404.1 RNA 2',3'-cyclic phosphodiesterase [Candidatus Thiodiazotropha weberae]MCG8001688.1 RNA 2',3'-cyclic phosphodiesterase [Candidatus Thiodiazotropha lotti]MCW4185427.1 RNA 2',3'-cyclic phosphodiesterase [Candidatus Thiodiazotropha weberae]
MPDQRLFFALWPGADVREALLQQLSVGPAVKGRRHHPDDLHMTLVFLGQLRGRKPACIEQAAESLAGQSFELILDHTGYWPKPKIVWLAPQSTPEPLIHLVDGLKQRLTECGFEPEQRLYKPHVTLFRKAQRISPWQLMQPIQWPVKEFVLASSNNPQPNQSRYKILQRWSLK